jgi:hypothetical protein
MTMHVDDDARPTHQHNTHPTGVRGYREAIIIFIQIASDRISISISSVIRSAGNYQLSGRGK